MENIVQVMLETPHYPSRPCFLGGGAIFSLTVACFNHVIVVSFCTLLVILLM
jgi:hypothetical protein